MAVTNFDKPVGTEIDALNSKIEIVTKTEIANTSIAVSGDESWHSVDNNYLTNLSQYKKVLIKVGMHGALYNTFVFDVDAILNAHIPVNCSIFWDSFNQGTIVFQYNSLRYSAMAKCKQLAFDYEIWGLK